MIRHTPRASALALCALLVAAPLAAALSTGTGLFSPLTPTAADAPEITHVTIESVDGVAVAATVFKPAAASASEPVPLIFHSHGWGGSRVTEANGTVGALLDAGYGVLTFDARGHGESGGVATVHNRDHEVKDFHVLLDYAHDALPWVAREAASPLDKDVVAGAFGYSYGGGFQTMTISYDGRLDAAVPEMTWNDLRYSLAPNGVVKSAWVDALYWSAKAGGTRISEDIDAWYQEIMLTNDVPQDALDHFALSSPTFGAAGDVDVLIIQGIPDVLFNLNEGLANYRQLEDASTGDVRLSTHLTGHVLPGVQPLGLDPYRTDQSADRYPCGDMQAQTLAWFDEHLRGNAGAADAIPEVAYALENGECLELGSLDSEIAARRSFDALVAPQVAGSVLVPVLTGPAVVAGVPHLAATAVAPTGGTVNLGLVVAGPSGGMHVVDDQATAFRVTGESVDVDLAGVATRLGDGDTLFLRIDGLNEWYAHNGARTPGAVVFTDVEVTLPLVDA